MSNDVKTSFFDKQMTRRQFLKISGKSIAGLTVSATMLSLFGCSQREIENEQVATWALPQGLLVVNTAKCTGCERCEHNCTLVNDGEISTYVSRVKVSRNLHIHGKDGMYNSSFTYYPDTCRQCKDPACGNACPQKAIIANGQGTRVVDESKCVGCGACVEACPWHMPAVNPETNKSSKCIACGACAAGCPSGALAIIPWDEVTAAAQAIV
ncbi:MAG: ferredoxin-like protein [Anaerocolumna aminovalerica]|jgi:Fe-S-cluster-containing dehydrogenase component|uniref:ferredoxin-like protein n=1 Tax=Anaerocolumna aminovalerica TaxID=1527 RepID=UPI000BE48E5E|nr:ferredoxin-like protein [Anaerocolumna aminovalerica]MBU5332983.1 ferredoxin-like protein [Anaerocolumna aminovalerica]MDU6266109.1 ferredoxin-like protein [Anaerocolumna aminovalerica]